MYSAIPGLGVTLDLMASGSSSSRCTLLLTIIRFLDVTGILNLQEQPERTLS